MSQTKFDPKIPFTLQVEVTQDDWDRARAFQRDAQEANVLFDVTYYCVAGQAINRAFREKFPEELESVYVTCSSRSVTVRREREPPLHRKVQGEILSAIDELVAPPELAAVVEAFDRSGAALARPTTKFELHFSEEFALD